MRSSSPIWQRITSGSAVVVMSLAALFVSMPSAESAVVPLVTGVLVDSTGVPLAAAPAFVAGGIQDPNQVTNDKGQFSIPTAETSPQLVFEYARTNVGSGLTIVTKPLTGGAADVGTVTMPPLDSATIRIVDSKGSPVA
ncbi:hypothetical protein, partial [Arthrobacter sp. PM3]|uniref:hypothetical protein n=1 Tax=Arthrobacter sp. PM3 TaxID=2017685 RepID=UPI001ABFBD14